MPWARAPELDRAIQSIVQRWVAPSLFATCAACSSVHPVSPTPPDRRDPDAAVDSGAFHGEVTDADA